MIDKRQAKLIHENVGGYWLVNSPDFDPNQTHARSTYDSWDSWYWLVVSLEIPQTKFHPTTKN